MHVTVPPTTSTNVTNLKADFKWVSNVNHFALTQHFQLSQALGTVTGPGCGVTVLSDVRRSDSESLPWHGLRVTTVTQTVTASDSEPESQWSQAGCHI